MNCSEEGSREKANSVAELGLADRPCKLPRISDVDMFSSDIAELHHASASTADNCIHSSGEVEIVSPSPLQHYKSSALQNASIVMGTRTMLQHAAYRQRQNVESYLDVEESDDVEPDGSSTCSGSEVSLCVQNSGYAAVVTEADASPIIHTGRHTANKLDHLIADERQKLLSRSHGLSASQNSAHLLDRQGTSAVNEFHSDDVARDNEVVDLVTQSLTADQSFDSCTSEDLDSSEVNMRLFIYLDDVPCVQKKWFYCHFET